MTAQKKYELWLKDFVQESLNIEGIFRQPTDAELEATWAFIKLPEVTVPDLVALVAVYQPDAVLRDNPTKRVWIGGREAPEGGENLLYTLTTILDWTEGNRFCRESDVYSIHCDYEHLHPFTDGNGRSGRALWANLMWHQGYDFRYKFLQMFYYQTLSDYSAYV